MLSVHWPEPPPRVSRAAVSPHVQRRVDEAERRAVRAALVLGGLVVVLLIAADAAHAVLRYGDAGRSMAAIQVVEMALVLGVSVAIRRRIARPEALGVVLLGVLYAVTLAQVNLVPEMAPLSSAYLATVLVASGLFVPWAPRWHRAWIGLAGLLTVAWALIPASPGGFTQRELTVSAVAIAGAASLVGQQLWHVRMRRMLEQQFELRWLSRRAQRQELLVRELNRDLERTARLDVLTALGNRLALDATIAQLGDTPMSAILLDIDHFKHFNDRYGHLAGDAALARVAELLSGAVRGRDLAFRYGGEEFLVLLPATAIGRAEAIAERIRRVIEDDERTNTWGLTISAGVASSDGADGGDPKPLLRRADAALYAAKRAGRNRVAVDAEAGGARAGGAGASEGEAGGVRPVEAVGA